MNKQSLPTLPLELEKFTIFAHQQILNKNHSQHANIKYYIPW